MIDIDTSKLLEKEMNRKDFLKNVGLGVIAFSGVAAALRAFGQVPSAMVTAPVQDNAASMASYGGSVYGGRPVQRTHSNG